ncbi:ABC transporter permease subunit [Gorillibacterium massiliense]|uniref:ABC transporter permease subunit n=1 Tax=Gorillibacterium massiliense TaxID=1280390 RepID=UPI0004B72B0A|nr:ABC transporter permease subunit [Gorillibacterium massiliense]
MNIFRHEWRSISRSTLIWTLSMSAVAALFFLLFPAISAESSDYLDVLNNYPKPLRDALGINVEMMGTVLGFYSFAFSFILLCAAIQAANLGFGILSKESREKTADFLLTKPVSRGQIVTAKLSAAVAALVVTNVVYMAISGFLAWQVKDAPFKWSTFLLISLSALMLQLLFLSLGLFVSVLVRKIRSVPSVSLGVVLGFYIVGMLGSVIGDKAVRYITPFKYFDTTYVIGHNAYETPYVILAAVLIILFTAAAYVIYRKKDIHAV